MNAVVPRPKVRTVERGGGIISDGNAARLRVNEMHLLLTATVEKESAVVGDETFFEVPRGPEHETPLLLFFLFFRQFLFQPPEVREDFPGLFETSVAVGRNLERPVSTGRERNPSMNRLRLGPSGLKRRVQENAGAYFVVDRRINA